VLLFDGLWTGSSLVPREEGRWGPPMGGCDLRTVELLVHVACSVGRVAQTPIRGVDGLCVELTASRARSVLAGLWSLHCLDAVELCTDAARRYLEYREERRPNRSLLALAGTGLRGRAVADMQREALRDGRATGAAVPPRLNTLAALVLFGLA
jgi:hypothetical protein